ncbi:MAG TPA: hypothetical protein VLQ91_05385 [Draconibacterium sp.]|nr:hypothetical protein [Draconibacterium sp.]
MKPKLFYLILFLFSLVYSPNCYAQILKKLKTAVTQAAEQGLQKKPGQELDSVSENQQKSNEQAENKLGNFFKGGEKIPIGESYTFNTNVIYEMQTINDGKPVQMDYSLWFSPADNYMGMAMQNLKTEQDQKNQIPEMFTILDEGHEAIIIIMEEQKMAQVMSMESIKKMAKESKEVDIKENNKEAYKVEKTGKTKKILGFTADEYISQTDEGKITYWVTKDLNFYQKNMFYSLNKSMGGNNFDLPEYANGFMLEMYFVGTAKDNTGDTMSMIIKDIQKKNKTVTMQNYQLMNLSGLMKN